MQAGYRRETFSDHPIGDEIGRGDLDRHVLHGEIDTTVGYGEHSLEVRYDHRYDRELRGASYAGFSIQGGLALTYTWRTKLVIARWFAGTTRR